MSYLIECKNLTAGYEGMPVVKDLSFNVSAGDYLCIVGENGSGKSTLMKTILGLRSALSGEIIFGDGLKQTEIGYLPQQTAAQKDFPATVREVVLSGCLGRKGLSPFYSKLLLLDEPVSGLDPMVTAEMYEIISRLNREQGITIIMISHDLQGALKYGTKILHMESGAYFFGTTAEYRSTDIFHAMSTCDCHCTCDHHTGSKEAR